MPGLLVQTSVGRVQEAAGHLSPFPILSLKTIKIDVFKEQQTNTKVGQIYQ